MDKFENMKGKTLISCVVGDDTIIFTVSNEEIYKQYHKQDCCEDVHVEDICGDLDDILNSPILMAEESSSTTSDDYGDSGTWTFYKLSTIKGSITIRWIGTSNGYYSEEVDFVRIK